MTYKEFGSSSYSVFLKPLAQIKDLFANILECSQYDSLAPFCTSPTLKHIGTYYVFVNPYVI